MPWVRNNEVQLPRELQSIKQLSSYSLSTDFYRSRNPIDSDLLKHLCMVFQLTVIPERDRSTTNRFMTKAIVRNGEVDIVFNAIRMNAVEQLNGNYVSRNNTIVNTQNNPGVVDELVQRFTAEGWVEQDYSTALICSPYHKTKVLVKESRERVKNTIVFTNILNDEFMCKFIAVLPAIHGYQINKPVIDAMLACDKQAFFNAMMAELEELFAARRREEAERKRKEAEARRVEIVRQLDNLVVHINTVKSGDLNGKITRKQESINSYIAELRSLYQQLNELKVKQASTYWSDTTSRAGEFVQYIKESDLNNITNIRSGSSGTDIVLLTKLLYWDEEVYKSYMNSTRSNCITNCYNEIRALLNNIFLDKTVSVIFHTPIKIKFGDERVERNQGYSMGEWLGIPHTHVYHYNCWGNNEPLIQGAFNRQDYIVLWEQIKATLSGLNLTDSTVFNRFVNDYFRNPTSINCLIVPGLEQPISPQEFIRIYPNGYRPETTVTVTPEPQEEPNQDSVDDLF